MVLIDAGLVLYVGLGVLLIWRYCCAWRCCGKWLQYANYCSLFLGLIFVILAYDSYSFIQVALSEQGKESWSGMPDWLRWWVLISPGICLAIYLLTSVQTFHHVERIKEDTAVLRHDRAVQIILLPLVYSVMGMSSITRMYTFIGSAVNPYDDSNKELMHDSLSRSETCFWVGDLYEAWALFQFGKLTLEVVKSGILAQKQSPDAGIAAAGVALEKSHEAVESLAWLGIMSFVLVCLAEAGWSLWLLTFSTVAGNAFDESMSQFTIAGFLASGAAIYNVYIVEESYHPYLKKYYPRWKFVTVKILVSFAFVQRGCFKILMSLGPMMPKKMKSGADSLPIIGTLLNFPRAQFELFYGSLIITECLLVCIAHYWAWDSREEWYDEADVAELQDDLETMALRGPIDKSYGAPQARH